MSSTPAPPARPPKTSPGRTITHGTSASRTASSAASFERLYAPPPFAIARVLTCTNRRTLVDAASSARVPSTLTVLYVRSLRAWVAAARCSTASTESSRSWTAAGRARSPDTTSSPPSTARSCTRHRVRQPALRSSGSTPRPSTPEAPVTRIVRASATGSDTASEHIAKELDRRGGLDERLPLLVAPEDHRHLGNAQTQPPCLENDLGVDEPVVGLQRHALVRCARHALRLAVDVPETPSAKEEAEEEVVDDRGEPPVEAVVPGDAQGLHHVSAGVAHQDEHANDVLRRVLRVAVDRDHDLAGSCRQARLEVPAHRSLLRLADHEHVLVCRGERPDDVRRVVVLPRPVVGDGDELERLARRDELPVERLEHGADLVARAVAEDDRGEVGHPLSRPMAIRSFAQPRTETSRSA